MKLTPTIDPRPDEPCRPTAPKPRLTYPRFVIPQQEFRLTPDLRMVFWKANGDKKDANITDTLARAAEAFYRAAHPPANLTTAQQRLRREQHLGLGNALADLSITGRTAYSNFKAKAPTDASLVAATRAKLPQSATPADVAEAIKKALDRAYAVAWALRGPVAQRAALREPLGWIAVSGEDDKPHRPVNNDPPPFEQFEVAVKSHGQTFQTRFFIASAVKGPTPSAIPVSTRALPPDPVPSIPTGHKVILFLHGHSSGAEEALEIIPHILKAGMARGRKYAIISFDLPNNGYSESFDHTRIAPSKETTFPAGIFDHSTPIKTPILDFEEDFVAAFVDAVDKVASIKQRFAGVIGGSLGGNLGLRLGRRNLVRDPWLKAGIVSWSPASVWDPMVQDELKRKAPEHCRDQWNVEEGPGTRWDYFNEVYDLKRFIWPHTQPEAWYRAGWEPCKTHHIQESRVARQEIYDANYRKWHWRLAGEQLIYSHVDRVNHFNKSTPFRYELNKVRQLLIAGAADDWQWVNIYSASRTLAALMVHTPGTSLFLSQTGHSIHFERPRFLAREIATFLH
jgi:pimeloyl-ACP methyl ester carboxylesterase